MNEAKANLQAKRRRQLYKFYGGLAGAILLITAGVWRIDPVAGGLVLVGMISLCGAILTGLLMVLERIDGDL